MNFLEYLIVISLGIWFPISCAAFLMGYIRGRVYDSDSWSDGYEVGYRVGKSESDEEKYGLNV